VAKFTYEDGADFDGKLDKMSRGTVKTIVMAGADECTKDMQAAIGNYHHVGKTGSMQKNVRPGIYHEDLNSGWVEVYPQGTDSRGVSNAKKAFVIDRGIGANPTIRSNRKVKNKTGDKFIRKNEKQFKSDVQRAMQAASDRLIADTFK
jgi:hypothetical protein